MTGYQERKAQAIAEAVADKARGFTVAAGAKVTSIYDESQATIVSGPDPRGFYVVSHEEPLVFSDWKREEFLFPVRPLDRLLGIRKSILHGGWETEPESTQALMQRTDPVGYQECRDAGRF